MNMHMLFCAQWKEAGRKTDWLHEPGSGFGRLLAAIAIIGIAVCILDHAAAGKGRADTLVASSQQGSWK